MIYAITRNGSKVIIKDITTAIGASYAGCEIHLTGDVIINSSTIIPSDRELVLDEVGSVTISSGHVLTLRCPTAGKQNFTGTVVFDYDNGFRRVESGSYEIMQSDFGTEIQVALDAVIAVGGGVLVLDQSLSVSTPITGTLTAPVTIKILPNVIISKTVDGHLFDLTLSGTGTIMFEGAGHLRAAWAGVASTTAAAIKVVGVGYDRCFVMESPIWIDTAAGTLGYGVWKYGLHLTDVNTPILANFLITGESFSNTTMTGVYCWSHNYLSVGWNVTNVECLKMWNGFELQTDHSAGIEGVCFDNVQCICHNHGLVYGNSTTYMPPMIELIGCHMNCDNSPVVITRAINVHINGGLYYRDGVAGDNATSAFFEFYGVQELKLSGFSASIIDAAVDVPLVIIGSDAGTSPQTNMVSAYATMSNVFCWMGGAKTAPIVRCLNTVSGEFRIDEMCKKDTTGAWFDHTQTYVGYTAPRIYNNAADLVYAYRNVLTPTANTEITLAANTTYTVTVNLNPAGSIASTRMLSFAAASTTSGDGAHLVLLVGGSFFSTSLYWVKELERQAVGFTVSTITIGGPFNTSLIFTIATTARAANFVWESIGITDTQNAPVTVTVV